MSDTEAPMRSRTEPEPSGRAPAYYPDDEISLIDLWNVLVRRRWLIAGVTLLCLLVSGLYTILVTPVYESRSVLLVGKVASIGPVEDPNEMTFRLREAYRVDDDTEGDREMPYLEAVSLDRREADHVITLRARAETPEDASRFLEGVANEILDAHRASFGAAVAVLEARLESLEIQRQAFESQIALIQEEMERVREVNPVQASVLAVESGKLMAQLPELEGRRAGVELNLLEARSYPTALLRAPTVAIKPIQPRPALYAALGLMLGLMLGVFSAFFAEFLRNARAQPAASSAP